MSEILYPVEMVLLDHPCYGVDIYAAENAEDMEVLRGQGYVTTDEVIALASKASAYRAALEPFAEIYVDIMSRPEAETIVDESQTIISVGLLRQAYDVRGDE